MRNIVIIAAVCLSILLAGCAAEQKPGAETPFIGGTDGVKVDFVEGSPPAEVYDNNQFPFEVTLRLQNKGESTVNPGEYKIELSGISMQDFGGPSYSQSPGERLEGAYKDQEGNKVEGATRYVTFGNPSFKYKHNLVGNTQFTLRADLCYKYKTTATSQICVRENVLKLGEEGVCEVSGDKAVFNSGSPVQVASFRQSSGGENKIAFTFEVAHKGIGAVHGGTLCDTTLANKNKVHVKVTSGVGTIACSGLGGSNEGDVVLYEGKRTVSCVQNIGVGAKDYETPLTINLGFNYREHVDTPLLVKHAVTG